MDYAHQDFPAMRYGPNGASVIVNDESETPKGYEDHPAKVKGFEAAEGTHTAIAPSNGLKSADQASKTRTADSQTITPPEVAAKTDPIGNSAGNAKDSGETVDPAKAKAPSDETNKNADPGKIEIDADGHAFDPSLHAATKSKTKAGLWRMKVGVTRPAPLAAKPPLDL